VEAVTRVQPVTVVGEAPDVVTLVDPLAGTVIENVLAVAVPMVTLKGAPESAKKVMVAVVSLVVPFVRSRTVL